MYCMWSLVLTIQLIGFSCVQGNELVGAKEETTIANQKDDTTRQSNPLQAAANPSSQDETPNKLPIEPRAGDRTLVKDIVDRLHALDNDIGKLLYNSTSMYQPSDEVIARQDQRESGSQKFSEILNDLDSLQDEIGGMVANASRTRQYNILVRLRPLNNILYRIRHNLHLMRNSLVAINTVASLEKFGNSVLDSTLAAFMRPDANLNDEIGDSGNYDINLDRLDDLPPNATASSQTLQTAVASTTTTTTTMATTPSTTTTTTTTTTPAPTSTTAKPTPSSTTPAISETPETSKQPVPSRAPVHRNPTRRVNQRQNQRRTTQRPTASTPRVSVQ